MKECKEIETLAGNSQEPSVEIYGHHYITPVQSPQAAVVCVRTRLFY